MVQIRLTQSGSSSTLPTVSATDPTVALLMTVERLAAIFENQKGASLLRRTNAS